MGQSYWDGPDGIQEATLTSNGGGTQSMIQTGNKESVTTEMVKQKDSKI